jgi:chromate transporter
MQVFDVPFPLIVAGAAVAGVAIGRYAPHALAPPPTHGTRAAPHAAAVIDDDTPVPPHARYSPRRLAVVVTASVALWGIALSATAALGDAYAAMAWLFTKAALVTFGGAYAVLPYIVQQAVEHHGWLTAAQMIDGLALGETTPGPLIMIVAFVGFVAGWAKTMLGPEALALAGIVGATVATFFTFLPSFLFILAGGPLVEATHGDARVTAPLTGITAAVVGVIGSLAVFFAVHVFWPGGFDAAHPWAGIDAFGVALFAIALALLFRFNLGVIPLVLAGAAAGLVRALL